MKSFHFKVFPDQKLGYMVYISFTEKLQFPMSPKPVLFPPQHITTSKTNAKLTEQRKTKKMCPVTQHPALLATLEFPRKSIPIAFFHYLDF